MAQAVRLNFSDPELPGLGKFGVEASNAEGVIADFYITVSVDSTVVIPLTQIANNVPIGDDYTNYDNAIPTDASTGKYLAGVYEIVITAKDSTSVTTLNTYTATFGFNPYNEEIRTQALSIGKDINCLEGFVLFTDETTYREADDTTLRREWLVTPPTIMGVPGTPVEGSDTFVKHFFTHVNTAYQVLFKAFISYTLVDDDITVTETHRLSSDFVYLVDCQNNLSEVKQCLYDTLASLDAAACKLGGFDKLSGADRSKWFALQQALAGWTVANECEDPTSRQAFFLQIKNLLGCSCEEDTEVRAFVLPDGSEQVQTAWEIVTTPFLNSFVNNTIPLRWRITKDNELRLLGKIQIPSGLVVSTPVTVTTGFIPTSRLEAIDDSGVIAMQYPVFTASGAEAVGTLQIQADSDLVFTPGVDYSASEFVYINISIPLDA